jgi:hypothetical protein
MFHHKFCPPPEHCERREDMDIWFNGFIAGLKAAIEVVKGPHTSETEAHTDNVVPEDINSE